MPSEGEEVRELQALLCAGPPSRRARANLHRAGTSIPTNQQYDSTSVGHAFAAVVTQGLLNKYAVPMNPEHVVEKVEVLCPCWEGHWPRDMCEEWNQIHETEGASLKDTDRASLGLRILGDYNKTSLNPSGRTPSAKKKLIKPSAVN